MSHENNSRTTPFYKQVPITKTQVINTTNLDGLLGYKAFSLVPNTFMNTHSPSFINTFREMYG